MKKIPIATYKTEDDSRWEAGFKCFKVDSSEERKAGMRMFGQEIKDYILFEFFDHKGQQIKILTADTKEYAISIVKKYMGYGFQKV